MHFVTAVFNIARLVCSRTQCKKVQVCKHLCEALNTSLPTVDSNGRWMPSLGCHLGITSSYANDGMTLSNKNSAIVNLTPQCNSET